MAACLMKCRPGCPESGRQPFPEGHEKAPRAQIRGHEILPNPLVERSQPPVEHRIVQHSVVQKIASREPRSNVFPFS